MILSVIIVSYNVRSFLEQCLFSVERSLDQLRNSGDSEIIVVDNDSHDGSIEYLRARFPRVQLIANDHNKGFAVANNQALQMAKGKYILFLNPDTILPEDCCRICIDFLESTPAAGAAGLRMVDGNGLFLPESRRGFPTAWVAFCKLSGLAALFPRSRFFAAYYLGYLPQDINHPAPVLSGACLWTSRAVLDKTGSFDEQFFMYAEDIDLSYRILKEGYTNYYIADTTIIHFKGESTQKDLRYTKMFYKAMSQFRRKHRRGGFSGLMNIFVELGIWIRGGIAALGTLRSRFHPLDRRLADQRPIPDPSGSKTSAQTGVRLTGDPIAILTLKERLPAAGITVLTAKQDAKEIILCQGRSFSFKNCIETLQRGPADISWKIHAAGSDSLAGSHSHIDLLVFKKP